MDPLANDVADSGADNTTASNSGTGQTLEELKLGAKRNVVYRYSVSGLFPLTDAWKKIPIFLQRCGTPYKVYMSELIEESVHTDCKSFCSLHHDFSDKAPREWSNAT